MCISLDWKCVVIEWKGMHAKFVKKKECFLYVENYVDDVYVFMEANTEEMVMKHESPPISKPNQGNLGYNSWTFVT